MRNKLKGFKDKITKRNIIELVIMTIIFIIGAQVVYENEIKPRMSDAYTEESVQPDDDRSYIPLTEGETITQVFTFPKDQMIALGVELFSDADKNKGELSIQFYDNTTNELITESTYDVSRLIDMSIEDRDTIAYFNAGTNEMLTGNEGRQIRAELTVDSLSEKSQVYIYVNQDDEDDLYEPAVITGSSEEVSEDTSMVVRSYCYQYGYWKWYWRMGCVLLYAMMLFTYLGIFVCQIKLHHAFIVVGGTFAICYTFLILPVAVPDEMNHISSAYYYSNVLLGVEEPENTEGYTNTQGIFMRKTDLEAMAHFDTTPRLKEYDYIQWHILRGTNEGDDELVLFGKTKESDNWTLYAAGTLGITLGRLLGMNGITTFFMGRLFAVLLYLTVFYWAIKKIPIGKAALFLFAIAPMCMQQGCSYSYDAVPLEASVLFLSCLFNILYEDRKVTRKDIILLGVLTFFVASCKGGVYIPECLLVFLIPADKFENKKIKKRMMLILMATSFAGFLINTLPYLLQVLGVTQAATATQTYSESLNCYTVSDVIFHPVHSIYVVITTLLMYADYYFQGMFAGPLGWLNISVNPFNAYLLFALMLLGVTTVKGEEVRVTNKQKIFFGIAWLLTFGMSLASMFISWTTNGSTTISGVQGRYFTPIFLYLLFVLRGKFITINRNIDRILIFVGIGVNMIILDNILSSIQSVM